LRFTKLILFSSTLGIISSCDVSGITGNLNLFCKGKYIHSYKFNGKDI